MNWFLIPLINGPQEFEISLGGVNYTFVVKWNDSDEAGWQFDILDADSGEYLCAGQPLVTGTDLLAGLEYLGIEGKLVVYTNGDASAVPTFDNLGTNSNLFFLAEAA
jgi:hypothetical protein